MYDATSREWVPFKLWAAQRSTLAALDDHRLVVVLKARQLGLSWLVLCYALWLMLFRPSATVLLFSRRDEEAIDLLDFRLKGTYERLPPWLRGRGVRVDAKHDWQLANGSRALAFPTTGGRSYTGSLVIVDEADFMPDLDGLLNAVKPTIDAGGRLVLVSTADKSALRSAFKRIYQAAKAGQTQWHAVFLPWHARPGRDAGWYESVKADVLARTGALDNLWQEYPATEDEALSPRTLDKRVPANWLLQCYHPTPALALPPTAPSIPGLQVYRLPEAGRQYVIGADPAEGNPTSDDSAATVLDRRTGEEVASLAGKLEPSVFASYLDTLGRWYNGAGVLVERNNHGHAVLLWLRDHSRLVRLRGHDGGEGWLSSTKGKALMYGYAADALRNRETVLHTPETYYQLSSIEGATLLAPDGEHDDRADGYALAIAASLNTGGASTQTSYLR